MFPFAALLFAGLVNAQHVVLLSSKIWNNTATVEPTDDVTLKAIVHFHFAADHHSIVQTSLDAPCTPLKGGFASPLDSKKGDQFSISVGDHLKPIWYACAQHCHEGEVGAIAPINAADGSGWLDPENNWGTFLKNAAASANSFEGLPQDGTPIGSGVDAWVISNLGVPYSTPSHGATEPTPTSSGSRGVIHLTSAAIGGLAVAAVALVALIGLAAWCIRVIMLKHRREKTKQWAAQKLVMNDPLPIAGSDKPAMKEKDAASAV
ncbi:hypothetical protein AURDEDRAFT_187101 [Auricularia subglabra TFB-10046 SS5]|uniref:Cupredoxin n=1 Tax=Auricularia subglabra (strain TFB-10046 / SS5) TaxID=717982 RepID=J0LJD9_AURST|nr:hypothetical protein AURDEDRAFT_187101 [Auricularia subglabra TFB-10046 SS5]